MNILVTGFPGTLGSAVVESLGKGGHKVRILLHGSAIDPVSFNYDLEVVWGSLSHHQKFDELTKDVDAVVHCAWDRRGEDDGMMEKVNLGGTLALIEAAERNSVKTFVHISSVGVYGLNRSLWGKTLDEGHPCVSEEESLNPYPWVKVLIDKECEKLQGKLKMNLAIVRPGLIISDTIAPSKKLITTPKKHFGLFVGNAKNHLPYIHVSDIAEMISIILENPPKYGVYNCVPAQHLPAAQFFKNWAKYRGFSARVLRLPPAFLRLMTWGVRKLKSALGRRTGDSKIDYQILTGKCDIRYSADRAIQELGWHDSLTQSIATDPDLS